jgi:hypothetical protein
VHAATGDYDGADAFISYHPRFTNTAIRNIQCGSYWSVVFTFETTRPEKWIDKSLIPTTHTSHAAARCPGAIDALCLMHTPVLCGIGVCRAHPPRSAQRRQPMLARKKSLSKRPSAPQALDGGSSSGMRNSKLTLRKSRLSDGSETPMSIAGS